MGGKWKKEKFSELCTITRGGSPRPIHNYIMDKGIPWVKIADATASNSRTINSTKEYIKSTGKQKSREVFPGDLILSNSATPGLPKFMGIYACIHDGWLLLRDFNGLHKEFCYYFLLHERENLVSQGNGSVFTNLKTDILKNHVVDVPTLSEQRAIAHILGTLDDKIELNRQMAQTLESIARAIFKSWFVDFDPVKAKMEGKQPEGMTEEIAALFPDRLVDSELGMIPEGWSPIPLSKMANFLNGLALQKYPPIGKDDLPVLKIAQLRSGKLDYDKLASNEISDKYLVSEGDLIFSWSGSLIVDVWAGPKCALNQHLFKVTPEKWATKGLLWVAIHEHIDNFRAIAAAKAVTMGHIKRSHLNEAMVILPSIEKVQNISGVLDILIQRSTTLKAESNTLINLRDTLLPQLISGKIRLNQPEDAAA
ncbi:restriction endonuclease subunit S [Thiolapillus sp.]|uniref:restriction endonuclease subunit S n=2 Tax=Thiolapillus sp. TaxID=2017437 RepID=UPI003AF7FF25